MSGSFLLFGTVCEDLANFFEFIQVLLFAVFEHPLHVAPAHELSAAVYPSKERFIALPVVVVSQRGNNIAGDKSIALRTGYENLIRFSWCTDEDVLDRCGATILAVLGM